MAAEGLLAQIAVQGFAGMLGNLASSYVSRTGRKLPYPEETIKTDLQEHLNVTFEKCYRIKTILSDDTPIETLSIYVDQVFISNSKKIDQYDLVDLVKKGHSAVITGTGGGGKSMFMRYLWLSLFEDSGGRIPFLLELRQLNSYSHDSLEDFIFHSIVKSGSKISQSNFNTAVKNGDFVLFLDGFDEINYEKRDYFQEKILSLKENNPKLSIIVTSRNDDRFGGWHQFTTYSVLPLTLDQSKELIRKAPYTEAMINRFLKKIDALYKTHDGFLSNPLLAYMMLVTFSFNPDIPKKMFLFYEQAFEDLYHRHDLTKGGYRRKFYSSLEKQDFLRLLSFVCLMSYYRENF